MKELDRLVEAVDAVLDITTTDISLDDIAQNLRVLVRQAHRVQAAVVAHTAAMTARTAYSVTGHGSTTEFLTQDCHYAGRDAARLERCAKQLGVELPCTAAALRTGDISWNHAVAVVRANEDLGTDYVKAHEANWIQNVAACSGPERLQRLVRAQLDERGLARTTPKCPEATGVPEHADLPEAHRATEQVADPVDNRPDLTETAMPLVPRQPRPTVVPVDGQRSRPTSTSHTGLDTEPTSTTSVDVSKAQILPCLDYPTSDEHSAISALPGAGCLHAGCRQAPEWRHVHYVVHWQDGGEAVVTTLTPICRTHYAEIEFQGQVAVLAPCQRTTSSTRNTPEHVA